MRLARVAVVTVALLALVVTGITLLLADGQDGAGGDRAGEPGSAPPSITPSAPPSITPSAPEDGTPSEPPPTDPSALPSFPGAEGFGATTPGGRGGRVINVTNLDDSGEGSFREAATAEGRRIVVFRVSGTINLLSPVDITTPYLTIAGQTAPGGGITLKADSCNDGGVLGVNTHDVVIRYLRLRPGPHPCAGPGESSDGIVVYKEGTRNVVIDHNSISWAVDENVSLYDHAQDITFSWNIIAEGLSNATHEEGEHSKGAHLSGENTDRISFHHNLLAHNNDRNPQPTNPGIADIRNNVVYNYGKHAAFTSNSHGRPSFNFIGNYFIPGADSDTSNYELDVYEGTPGAGWAFYVKDNIGPYRPQNDLPDEQTVSPEGRDSMVDSPFDTAPVTTTSPDVALQQVLERAGATVPYRDSADERVVADVRNGTGRLIDDPSEVGGWPELPAAEPPVDSDLDGMPDEWERRHGLRPDFDDSAEDRDGDGWTNIEEYINSLVQP